ncbi:toprim domain-containing protein [Tumebacillus flagellatus]|uniref:toprim domain-containing protein n=1 Tax=Tumebacillus flagellatus TaxID=1157490 RepID=UPI00056EF2FD|nr:toprim domain-containing protein [Tumebacillus flagellatus]
MAHPPKILIVEGKTDRTRLLQVLTEPVEFVLTYGTMSDDKLEELIWPLVDEDDVYILVDADDSGNKLRSLLKRELPNARHLYTRKLFREVAATPLEHLAEILHREHFEVRVELLPENRPPEGKQT